MSSSQTTPDAAGLCSRPLVRRAYMAAAVGVAAFFVVQIGLREPFRGYQTEVSLSGTASAAIDPDALQRWVKAADSHAAVAINGGTGSRSQIDVRIGRIGSRLHAAQTGLEGLARRVLMEYLPQADAAYRERIVDRLEQELQLARDTEQTLAARSRELAERRRPLASNAAIEQTPESTREMIIAPAPAASSTTETAAANSPLQTQLATLRLELSRLLANFTEEHPQVVAVRRQIANLEGQIGPEAPAADYEPAARSDFSGAAPNRSASYTSFPADDRLDDATTDAALSDLKEEQGHVSAQLNAATAARQAAERKLHTTLASFSVHAPAAGWSAEPARLVARLGGTPRMLPLVLSGLAAVVAGISMFRVTRVLVEPALLATTTDLARALPIPFVGQAPSPIKPGRSKLQRWITPARVQLLTRMAEMWLAAIVVTCLAAACLDPSLGSQFAADPLGVLSEIVGRLTGR